MCVIVILLVPDAQDRCFLLPVAFSMIISLKDTNHNPKHFFIKRSLLVITNILIYIYICSVTHIMVINTS